MTACLLHDGTLRACETISEQLKIAAATASGISIWLCCLLLQCCTYHMYRCQMQHHMLLVTKLASRNPTRSKSTQPRVADCCPATNAVARVMLYLNSRLRVEQSNILKMTRPELHCCIQQEMALFIDAVCWAGHGKHVLPTASQWHTDNHNTALHRPDRKQVSTCSIPAETLRLSFTHAL